MVRQLSAYLLENSGVTRVKHIGLGHRANSTRKLNVFPLMMPGRKTIAIIILNFRRGLSDTWHTTMCYYVSLYPRDERINRARKVAHVRPIFTLAGINRDFPIARCTLARACRYGSSPRLASPRRRLIVLIFSFSRVINRAILHYVIPR